jgi:protein TonB
MADRGLFTDLVASDSNHPKGRGFTLPVSLAVHGLVLVGVVVAPLLSSGELPAPTNVVKAFFTEPVVPAPPAPPPPPPAPSDPRLQRTRTSTPTPTTTFSQPSEIPARIEPDENAGGEGGMPGGLPGGETGGILDGVIGGTFLTAEPPPPPEVVHVGGNVKPPTRLKDVRPVYPAIAKPARVQGTVILECTIDPQGHVRDVRVLRGIPLLDQAATDAVRQWVYSPTLLNGVPVAVVMTVTVRFTLQ